MRITYIGHATLLLEMQGIRILTDPNFENKLGRLLPRVSAPGIALDKLPRIDAILLTHAHADHLSFSSLERLQRDVPLLAPPVVASWLARLGFTHAVPLDAGGMTEIAGGRLQVHAARATHRGNRYGFDRWRSAANMYLLATPEESVFFAGDTALTATTHQMVESVLWNQGRRLDVALLPIGHAPRWKPGFRRGHLTGEDALELFERLDARAMLPYHWGTFRHVTATAYDAIDRLRLRLESFARKEHVHILEPGETLVTDDQGIHIE